MKTSRVVVCSQEDPGESSTLSFRRPSLPLLDTWWFVVLGPFFHFSHLASTKCPAFGTCSERQPGISCCTSRGFQYLHIRGCSREVSGPRQGVVRRGWRTAATRANCFRGLTQKKRSTLFHPGEGPAQQLRSTPHYTGSGTNQARPQLRHRSLGACTFAAAEARLEPHFRVCKVVSRLFTFRDAPQ